MLLQNLNIIGHDGIKHIRIVEDKIRTIASDQSLLMPERNELSLVFEKVIAFPGLINSHDHLDFNLFPQTGNRIYKSYIEWGADIQSNNRKNIEDILSVPKEIRVEWGIYKNLANGITTVVNHGEYLNIKDPVIDIFQDCYSLHSVREKSWKFKLNRPFVKNQPFVIHVGEGIDIPAIEEINEVIKWNLFKRKVIAVHGVSMNIKQAKAFEALVWCPDSNFFLLNETAKVNELKKETKIIFGTDSTVSANWNVWEHLRLAKETKMLTDSELFESLTSLPAAVWGLNDRGVLMEGKNADVVIAGMKSENNPMDNFFALNPENILLILRKGEIILFDEALYSLLVSKVNIQKFSKMVINSINKFIKGDLTGLISKTKKYVPKINLFDL